MSIFFFFFFNDTATTEIYTLSLHDALPICCTAMPPPSAAMRSIDRSEIVSAWSKNQFRRSEEHTSELQSLAYLVCRLLLEKKKKKKSNAEADISERSVDPAYHCRQPV